MNQENPIYYWPFGNSIHVETVALLLREKADGHMDIQLNAEEPGEITP